METGREAAIRTILFPVDFSAACVAMAPFVKKAAAIFSARVTMLHATEPFSSSSGFEIMARPPREVEEDRERTARLKLKSFLEADFPARSSSRLVLAGDPATRVAQTVREGGFDLIVMPTHAGAFRRTLLGSTTAKVLNDADCPVLTTQHAETLRPAPLEHREWICAVGLQPDSERVVRYARRVAESAHAHLSLIHVVPSGEPGATLQLDLDDGLLSADMQLARSRIEELQRAAGSHARVSIASGPVKNALIQAARQLRADVLIIGRSPQSGASGRLRDLTYAVVRDAPCPVLSV